MIFKAAFPDCVHWYATAETEPLLPRLCFDPAEYKVQVIGHDDSAWSTTGGLDDHSAIQLIEHPVQEAEVDDISKELQQ